MPVHTRDEKVQLTHLIFQARYTDGYRFLDRAGEILQEIRNRFPLWSVVKIARTQATLRYAGIESLVANIGFEAIDLMRTEKQSLADAEKFAKVFGEQSEQLYTLVTEKLSASSTTRVGVRFHFLAPADSLEESDRVNCGSLRSAYQQKVGDVLGMQLVDGGTNFVFEDIESGTRRSIQTYSAITDQPPGSADYFGLGKPNGSGGLLVDIDTFTRPNKGHFPKLAIFIQEQFLKTKEIALALMHWMIHPKK